MLHALRKRPYEGVSFSRNRCRQQYVFGCTCLTAQRSLDCYMSLLMLVICSFVDVEHIAILLAKQCEENAAVCAARFVGRSVCDRPSTRDIVVLDEMFETFGLLDLRLPSSTEVSRLVWQRVTWRPTIICPYQVRHSLQEHEHYSIPSRKHTATMNYDELRACDQKTCPGENTATITLPDVNRNIQQSHIQVQNERQRTKETK